MVLEVILERSFDLLCEMNGQHQRRWFHRYQSQQVGCILHIALLLRARCFGVSNVGACLVVFLHDARLSIERIADGILFVLVPFLHGLFEQLLLSVVPVSILIFILQEFFLWTELIPNTQQNQIQFVPPRVKYVFSTFIEER